MNHLQDSRHKYFLLVSYSVTLIGFVVCLGWLFDIQLFKSAFVGFGYMKPQTAVGFMLSGIIFFLYVSNLWRAVYHLLSGTLILFGSILIYQSLLNYRFVADQITTNNLNSGVLPAHPSVATAACFFLMGVAFAGIRSDNRYVRKIIEAILYLVCLMAFIAFVGYLFFVPVANKLPLIASMAFNTADAFLLLAFSLSYMQPDIGFGKLFTGESLGNIVARKVFPKMIVAILILGFVRIELHRFQLISVEFGITLYTVAFVIVILVLIRSTASLLNRIDQKRKHAEDIIIQTNKNLEQKVEQRTLELTQANKELLNSSKRFFTVFDNNPIGMIITDTATNQLQYVNELFLSCFSYTQEEVIGKTPRELNLIEPRYQAEISSRLRREREVKNFELIVKKKDGTPFWSLASVQIVIFNEQRFALTSFLDITDLKTAEEKLKKSQDVFASSFKYSGIGKALLSPDGKWLEFNDVICRLTGYTNEELLSMHYNDITYPDDIGLDAPLVAQLLKREIPSYSIEKRYISKNREVIVAFLTVTLVWENETVPKFFICDVQDITQERKLNDLVLQKNSELQTTSASLYNKINQLEQVNNIIAHNFRGPIGTIKMLTENPSLFSRDEVLQLINTSSIALLNDLDDLLKLSQITLSKDVIHDDCDIRQRIDKVYTQLQGIIYQKNIELVIDVETARISYPQIYLDNILYNLISNAIKYSRTDITPKIVVSVKSIDNKTTLSVKDNGLGIDLDRYGDRMFKLSQVFHKGFDSKGVGLFITKTQIETLGGSIQVKSKVNEGAEFIVTF